MPTVKRAERQVGINPLQGGQRRAAETFESQGGGLERARQDVGFAIADVGERMARFGLDRYNRIKDAERDASNKTAIIAADNELSAWEAQNIYDPEKGAISKRGLSAQGLPEAVKAEFDKKVGEIRKGLVTPEQIEAFDRLWGNKWQQNDLNLRRHMGEQITVYRREELEGKILLGTNAAIRAASLGDPKQTALELGQVVSTIEESGKAAGLGDAAIAARVSAAKTKTHAGAIESLISSGRTQQARDYYAATRDQIGDEDTRSKIERDLTQSTDLAESQRHADRIMKEGGTRTEQRERAKAIENPEQRRTTLALIEHEHAVAEKAERDAKERDSQTVADLVDSGASLRDIMRTSAYRNMSLGERNQVKDTLERRAQGTPVKTDTETWVNLAEMARTDPRKFVEQNLLTYRGKLSQQDLQQMQDLKARITAGQQKEADATIMGILTPENIIRNTIGEKWQTGDDEVSDLRRRVNSRVEEMQRRTGKKPTDGEIQEIADNEWQSVLLTPGKWGAFLPGGESFTDVYKPIREVTIGDIPKDEQAAAAQALRNRGETPSPEAIVKMFIQKRRGAGQTRRP